MGAQRASRSSAAAGVVLPERYLLRRHIADGGMATVWCATDRTLERDVAVKLLARRFLEDEMAGRRFKREARTAAQLSSHANVVTIFDVGQCPTSTDEPGQPFIVMEYLPGGTAADALRSGRIERLEAVGWIQQVASALDYAHSRGVIHRDVKLSNFLLDGDRVLHVADFGIARLGSDDTLTGHGQVLGTAAYLAPERALGGPATEASDRYALAVAAFELLVGERPFTAEHFAAQARQHLDDAPPAASERNRSLPPEVDDVLWRGMAKRPDDRWPSATAFAYALAGALEAPVVLRPVARAPTAATRPLTRRAQLSGAQPRRPAPAVQRLGGTDEPGRRARLVAIGALAAAVIAVASALAAGSGGGGKRAHAPAAARPATTASRSAAAAPTTAAQPATPGATAPGPPDPNALESQGHTLIDAGNYAAAIPVLRRAVAASPRDSLNYAYALYDLGNALLLSGNPQAAIPILRQRLAIPNQTDVVTATLRAALRAAGQAAPSGGGAPAPPGHKHHGHGGQGD